MAKSYEYYLEIEFDNNNDTVIYEGNSYISSNHTADMVSLKYSGIRISFTRTYKKKWEDFRDQKNGPVMNHLKKALCCYMLAKGSIPECRAAVFAAEGREQELYDLKNKLNDQSGGKLDIKLRRSDFSRVFTGDTEERKALYNSMTFFIHSQLSGNSPHDSMRAAWSSLNALYTEIHGTGKEQEKLDELWEYIPQLNMNKTTEYIIGLDDSVWNSLDWEKYVENGISNQERKNNFKRLLDGLFAEQADFDSLLGGLLFAAAKEKFPDLVNNCTASNVKKRIAFMVCRYCYFKRNMSMHAGMPYPLYVFSEKEESRTENILVKILNYTVRDILTERYFCNNP